MAWIRTALFAGAGAAAASLTTIALLSRYEGHSALRPVNATSHVIHGTDAAAEGFDPGRTLPGAIINVGSALFWGGMFASVAPPRRSPRAIAGRAFMTALATGIIDYGLVPKRLRPGWELALQPRSVVLALAPAQRAKTSSLVPMVSRKGRKCRSGTRYGASVSMMA